MVALISGRTILDGTTLLSLIPMRLKILTLTFDARQDIYNPTGTNTKKRTSNNTITPIRQIIPIKFIPYPSYFSVLFSFTINLDPCTLAMINGVPLVM